MSGFVTAHKLSLLNVVKQSTPRQVSEAAAVNVPIRPGTEYLDIDHHFETATIYPAFTPNWNTTVYVIWITSTAIRVGFGTAPSSSGAALTYRISRTGGTIAVVSGDYSKTLTHSLNDATARFVFTPNWNTVVYVSSKAANTTTIGFSTTASQNQTVYYSRFTEIDSQTVTPTDDSETVSVTHSLGVPFVDAFFTPGWNTVVMPEDATRTDTAFRAKFQVPATGATLDVFTGEPIL